MLVAKDSYWPAETIAPGGASFPVPIRPSFHNGDLNLAYPLHSRLDNNSLCIYANSRIRVQWRILGGKNMSFGSTIAEARKKLQLSQKELAAKINISPQYLNDIEHGKRSPDSDMLIENLAKALNLDSTVLYYWARRFPPSDIKQGVPQEKIVEAYKAFRKTLKEKK
jgi:transcriptional regulator with XRE-family HTH domain